jgi:hypothetical protein
MADFKFTDVKQKKDHIISFELANNVGLFADAIKNKAPQPVFPR